MDYEFQRLHGMGEPLYEQIVGPWDRLCRLYALVGNHEDLLPYLVRRLLEKGANSSFVNRIIDERLPVADIVADPLAATVALDEKSHPRITFPVALFGASRRNSAGVDLSDTTALELLSQAMSQSLATPSVAAPRICGESQTAEHESVTYPADIDRIVGTVTQSTFEQVDLVLSFAAAAQPEWDAAGADVCVMALDRAADLYEAQGEALMALAVREAGRTVDDAVVELREAVAFLRYYAAPARLEFLVPQGMPGPTGRRTR